MAKKCVLVLLTTRVFVILHPNYLIINVLRKKENGDCGLPQAQSPV